MSSGFDSLESLQSTLDNLTKVLGEVQNKKIVTETHLQTAQEELHTLEQQLQDLTGMTDMNDIQDYIASKERELVDVTSDVNSLMCHINSNYTFTENDVSALRDLITKYNIPIADM